jgi:hypothetical protein
MSRAEPKVNLWIDCDAGIDDAQGLYRRSEGGRISHRVHLFQNKLVVLATIDLLEIRHYQLLARGLSCLRRLDKVLVSCFDLMFNAP